MKEAMSKNCVFFKLVHGSFTNNNDNGKKFDLTTHFIITPKSFNLLICNKNSRFVSKCLMHAIRDFLCLTQSMRSFTCFKHANKIYR
jgi:hypothetical protein